MAEAETCRLKRASKKGSLAHQHRNSPKHVPSLGVGRPGAVSWRLRCEDSLQQRRGRAGRVQKGVCFRLVPRGLGGIWFFVGS